MRFTSGSSVSTSTAMGRFAISGAGLISVLVWPAFQPWQVPPAVRRAASGIHATDLERQVRFLASDAMLGRAAPSGELDSAAAYIAAELTGARVRPFGDAWVLFSTPAIRGQSSRFLLFLCGSRWCAVFRDQRRTVSEPRFPHSGARECARRSCVRAAWLGQQGVGYRSV